MNAQRCFYLSNEINWLCHVSFNDEITQRMGESKTEAGRMVAVSVTRKVTTGDFFPLGLISPARMLPI